MNPRQQRAIQKEFAQMCRNYAGIVFDKEKQERRQLVEWIRPAPGDAILDAACGPGSLALELAAYSDQVAGIDLCLSMIRMGRQTRRQFCFHPAFAVADVEQMPFANGSFDLVTCTYSFANFPEPLKALKEFCRVTRNGGRIAVADVVAPEDPERCKHFNRLESLRSRIYTRVLKRTEFLRLFQMIGLDLEAFHFRRRRRQFRDWVRLAPARLIPGRTRRLRRMLLESIKADRAGLHARQFNDEIFFSHGTAWFLLRRHQTSGVIH